MNPIHTTTSLMLATTLALLAGCGGSSGGTVVADDPTDPFLATLDQNTNGLRRFPWGPDFDDDGDGHVQFIAGGSDYDDTDASTTANTGNGNFGEPVYYDTGNSPTGLYLADLDNDGHLDLVTSDQNDATVTIWWGAGDGSFSDSLTLPGSGGSAAVVGDFDEDGLLDIVAGSNNALYLNAGNRTFQNAISLGFFGYGNVVRDINNDGHLDLVGANYSNGVAVLLGNGDGTFSDPIATPGANSQGIAVADFDGDGLLDAVVTDLVDFAGSNLAYFRGNGDGSFADPVIIPLPNYAWEIAAADLNGDGHPDIVTTDFIVDNVFVLLGDGTGGFGPVTSYDAIGVEKLMIADYNGDTVPDLAIASQTQGLWLSFGNGDGSFGDFTLLGSQPSTFAVTAGDLDGDGVLDLVTIDISGNRAAVQLGQ